MNKYIKAAGCISIGTAKSLWTKLFHPSSYNGPFICYASPRSEIAIDKGGKLSIGKKLKIRDGSKIIVRRNGRCVIGNNCFVNSNSLIVCHEQIQIGDHCQISPGVQIYDHDHDFRDEQGIRSKKFRCSPVNIGNNVWIGADSVILRGTTIGDNSVIGAGSIVKGEIPANSVVLQKRNTIIKDI